jgi:hypothetical protein
MSKIRVQLLLFMFVLLLQPFLLGQQVSSVTGVVTDKSGGSISGAEVQLADTRTNAVLTTKTNNLGAYTFINVKPGSGYSITFSAPSFQTLSISNVTLGVGITETHNATLEVGSTSTTIVVEAKGEATLNTVDASIGNVMDTRRIVDLPVQIRATPAALLSLQPGVVGNNLGTTSTNRVGAVTGARADQGNITVDGIDANDQATGQAFATVGNAPIDSVQEFRTVSAFPGADQGRSSGAQIEMVTKSGTNDFHGSVREYHRNTLTAANSYFNNKSGIAKPKLIRNQFGASLGGPIVKDKLFFFFDYEGRRDAQGVSYVRTVPLSHVLSGSLGYINNNPGCTEDSRIDTTPDCISFLTPQQVAALDPLGIGANGALLSFLKDRYPAANDLTGGDGVNTGFFRFNSPSKRADNIYTTHIDYSLSAKQQVSGRLTVTRSANTDTTNLVAQQFPGDPETAQIQRQDYSYVIGHTWSINPRMINRLTVGVSRSSLSFPILFHPAFPTIWTWGQGRDDLSSTSSTVPNQLSAPYIDISSQDRQVPVPTFKDDYSWVIGSHTMEFGGMFKPIRQKSSLVNDFNFVTVGLGGITDALDPSLRPNNILDSDVATAQWDYAFALALGRVAEVDTNFNYDRSSQAFAPGTGKKRNFHYNEFEFYWQDTWKVRRDLTMSYGLRWQYYSPPFEADGFQAINDVDMRNLFNLRLENAAAGVSGNNAEPFVRYDLGGKANDARGYYDPDLNNFSPRLSFAYNPSFTSGMMGKLFGDRKTVLRAGGSVVYDRISGTITFIQDQASYLFDNSKNTPFGALDPREALLSDPRFTGINNLPFQNTAPVISRPLEPYVDAGVPLGNAQGQLNYAVDQQFRTPYSLTYGIGLQRELPGNFILDLSYVGRQGRKLFAQADVAQALNFKDASSGQFLFSAFNELKTQILAGTPGAQITTQPWFENQISSALGAPCADVFGVSCTRVMRGFFSSLLRIGDISDTLQALYANGLLNANVGLSGQFSDNVYNTNLGASTYNGMLLSLRKRYSQNLQFDFNYTLSHSIDNQSSVVNTVVGGLVCDLTDLRVCRGNSDFDVTHLFNSNWVYDLPLGKGQRFFTGASKVADYIIGGWTVTGIFAARSGLPWNPTTGSYPVSFVVDSPAVQTSSEVPTGNVNISGSSIQFFDDPTAAKALFRNPDGGEVGNRNSLRGPAFWNVDLTIQKVFKMPYAESHDLKFQCSMFNAFNHNSFGLPSTNINSSAFGRISSSASTAREVQFALRYEF